jgi:PAS domain S-box-containing protein
MSHDSPVAPSSPPDEALRPAPTIDDRYRQLFEENAAVQLLVDPATGAIVDANRAAADFYGMSRVALAARSFGELADVPADEVMQTLEVAAEVGTHAVGFPNRHASGDVRLVEVYAGPLHSGARRLVHLIVHDVTERLRAEAAARELHAERVAHQRTLDLHEALRRQETLSRIGALVAAVAHEVRNPLFALSSTLDAMRARLGDAPDVQRYFPVLGAQVERLTALMRDLLDYGKPVALAREPTVAGELVAVAIEQVRATAAERSVSVTQHPAPPDLPPVDADRQRAVQVLQNLLQNAVQHSPSGRDVEVRLAPARLGDRPAVAVEVLDRGPGFAPGETQRIFEPFYSRRAGGTGMGLALAHRLVHDHGGTITAANREGGGASLCVVLPARPDDPNQT